MSNDQRIRFTLDGQVFQKSREDFLQISELLPTEARKYSVLLGCRRLSPQQAIAAVTGVPAKRVHSQTAMRVLQRLGFQVELADREPFQKLVTPRHK
jgi:hypothetical protein